MTTLTTAHTPGPRPAADETYPILTVLLLILGGFVVPVVGWFAGVVMLIAGPRWTVGEKWLGTLAWPAVVALPLAGAVTAGALSSGNSTWALGTALVVGVVTALGVLPWTFAHLLRAGRR